ncbi:MAG: hypothetical protein ACI9LN_003285, partial [Saprospiraceae bacterium]
QTERYLDEVFDEVEITTDITYGQNITVLTVSDPDIGMPTLQDLKMDVYAPAGDTETDRPLLINLHSGNFLPQGTNGSVNGQRVDSVNVELAMRYAKMGYVVANIDYRLGWNPLDPEIDGRISGLINAAYRGIQDSRTAVRFFRKSIVENNNEYGICPDRVAMLGNGTGGYVVLGAATINNYEELLLPKFFNTDGTPMVVEGFNGDPFGIEQTPLNNPNHVEYSSDFNVAIHMGGAIGDSSWITADDVAIIGFQVPNDPFAPYEEDILVVPTTGDLIVEVQGAKIILEKANALGLNQAMIDANIDDGFTDGANANNGGVEGLYPVVRACPPSFFPPNAPQCEASPWEWWDAGFWSMVEHPSCPPGTFPACSFHTITLNSNQGMSATQGKTYLDTIVGYAAPRMYAVMDLGGTCTDFTIDTKEILTAAVVNLSVAPNPAATEMYFTSDDTMEAIEIYNFAGQLMTSSRVEATSFRLDRNGLANGMYIAKIRYAEGIVSQKVVFN